ncbi:hypothetical protein Tco_0531576 [Tanacetum coccineum]
MSQDVLLTVMNSMSLLGESVNMDGKRKESCNLEAELLKSQNAFNDLLKRYSQLEKHCISLEASIQLNQEIFQKDESCNNQNALEIPEFFENNDLKAQLQDKDSTICKLKDIIKSMREKSKEENVNYDYGEIETKNVELENRMFKLDLEPLAPMLLQNRDAHIDYIKYTQEQADILREIVEQSKAKQHLDKDAKKVVVTPKNKVKKVRFAEPLTSSSNIKQVESSKTSDSNTPVLSSTGLKCSTSKCGSKPTGNKKNDRISRTPSRNMKNKVEAQPRKVNEKNRVVEPIYDIDVKHSLLNANSEPICVTCKKSMFDSVHDMCLLDFVENVNSRAKSAKKHKKQNIWKPTGNVLTEVGLKWKPTGKTFTIVGNSCPLTRIASANDKKPDLSFFHVFGALYYPTNDNDDLDWYSMDRPFTGYLDEEYGLSILTSRIVMMRGMGTVLYCLRPVLHLTPHVSSQVSPLWKVLVWLSSQATVIMCSSLTDDGHSGSVLCLGAESVTMGCPAQSQYERDKNNAARDTWSLAERND